MYAIIFDFTIMCHIKRKSETLVFRIMIIWHKQFFFLFIILYYFIAVDVVFLFFFRTKMCNFIETQTIIALTFTDFC